MKVHALRLVGYDCVGAYSIRLRSWRVWCPEWMITAHGPTLREAIGMMRRSLRQYTEAGGSRGVDIEVDIEVDDA